VNRDIHTRPQALDPGVIAFFALILAAIGMGASPIFVRFAEVGPLTSAFWRVFLALPALWLWARYDRFANRPGAATAGSAATIDRGANRAIVIAGLMFAGDLIFWHLAIVKTSVANATFLATLAPVWVVLGSRLLIGEQVERRVLAGLALGLAGMACLIGGTMTLKPENLAGDLDGVVTSFFFGAYFLAVRRARRTFSSGQALFLSSIVTAAVLFAFAISLEDMIWPLTAYGVAALVALALISHAGGQGLLSFALGYLPAAFSALVIFVEGVAAAILGWLILDEAIGLTQFLGALSIFVGITFARPRTAR
jgi:drug/metabolite transporter (DMT)-like permease